MGDPLVVRVLFQLLYFCISGLLNIQLNQLKVQSTLNRLKVSELSRFFMLTLPGGRL